MAIGWRRDGCQLFLLVQVLFKMYGDASKGGLVGREGLKAFILDVIAASPPLLAPPDLVVVADGDEGGGGDGGGGGGDGVSETSRPSASKTVLPHEKRTEGRAGVVAAADAACAAVLPQPDLEKELGGVLAGMAGVVLAEVHAKGFSVTTDPCFPFRRISW